MDGHALDLVGQRDEGQHRLEDAFGNFHLDQEVEDVAYTPQGLQN